MAAVLLIRHAESLANHGAPTSDPADIPLSDMGFTQAREFALQMEGRLAPDLIVTSHFVRAIQSAQPMLSLYPGVLTQCWDVYEFTYLSPARCVNMTSSERKPMVDLYWARSDPWYKDSPGAESFAMFIDRVDMALEEMQLLEGNVWIFGHGQFMQAMRWRHGEKGIVSAEGMRAFRAYDLDNPIANCTTIQMDI